MSEQETLPWDDEDTIESLRAKLTASQAEVKRLHGMLDRWREENTMTKSKNDSQEMIDIAAELRHESDLAWQIDDGTKLEWIPKSRTVKNEDGTFSIPMWLAKKKGFV